LERPALKTTGRFVVSRPVPYAHASGRRRGVAGGVSEGIERARAATPLR
jgi:hypothetical protein